MKVEKASFDDIDNFLLETFLKTRKATCKLVEGFLMYEIKTLYEKDEDITIKIKGFENLSKQDKKAVFNLLKMLKEFKKRR